MSDKNISNEINSILNSANKNYIEYDITIANKEIQKKNKTPKESQKLQNCKMLQARFDCACSWTVVVSASYSPDLSRINNFFKHGYCKF